MSCIRTSDSEDVSDILDTSFEGIYIYNVIDTTYQINNSGIPQLVLKIIIANQSSGSVVHTQFLNELRSFAITLQVR